MHMENGKLASFESIRPRLFGIGYRMLGNVADADDVVQEAFLRWHGASDALHSDEAWLISVTTRIAIDRLRRAASERTAYRGGWLPPVAAPPPDRNAELSEDLSRGLLLMLERLTPEERAVFLLREVFEAEYAEIARTVERTETACRQLVHRAKQHVRRRQRRFHVAADIRGRLAHRFIEALRAEDRDGVLAALTDEGRLFADRGGRLLAVAGATTSGEAGRAASRRLRASRSAERARSSPPWAAETSAGSWQGAPAGHFRVSTKATLQPLKRLPRSDAFT